MSELIPVLLLRSGQRLCALPIQHVLETFRPLPTEALGEASPFVLGLSRVRGEAVPVVGLNLLMGAAQGAPAQRFVSLRVDGRKLALAVDEVLDVREIQASAMEALPPLLSEAVPAVAGLAKLDAAFYLVLKAAKLLSNEDWLALEPGGFMMLDAKDTPRTSRPWWPGN